MNITRPTTTVISSVSGKRFGVNINADDWNNTYQIIGSFDTKDEANTKGKWFLKNFDNECKKIESGDTPPFFIMGMLQDNNIVRGHKKLTSIWN